MKKISAVIILALAMTACGTGGTKAVNTYEAELGSNVIVEYSEMKDGTWQSGEETYAKRVELTGKNEGEDTETTYVVLTNNENITFEEVSASVVNATDLPDAVVVEIRRS